MTIQDKSNQHNNNNNSFTPHRTVDQHHKETLNEVTTFGPDPCFIKPGWIYDTISIVNLCMITPIYSMMICFVTYICLLLIMSSMWIKTLLLMYLVYCICDSSPQSPKTPLLSNFKSWYRKWWSFRWVSYYFSCRLHRTTKLDATKKYIFVYHPHGVISFGVNMTLTTDSCNFEKAFPGIKRTSATLNATFLVPFFREWLLAIGFCSANKKTLVERLKTESLVLLPGGAAEALLTQRGTMKLYLKKRKGFVKLAMESDAQLVPVIGFGENEIFDTLSSSKGASWQQLLMKHLGFSLPFFSNILPNQTPINVVTGHPIVFKKTDDLDDCHYQYIMAVRQLYDKYKTKFGYEHVELEIL